MDAESELADVEESWGLLGHESRCRFELEPASPAVRKRKSWKQLFSSNQPWIRSTFRRKWVIAIAVLVVSLVAVMLVSSLAATKQEVNEADTLSKTCSVSALRAQCALGYEVLLQLSSAALPALGPDLTTLRVQVEQQTDSRLHVKIVPTHVARWEVPEDVLPRPNNPSTPPTSPAYTFTCADVGQEFFFAVSRVAANATVQEALFNTSGFSFVFKDQYLELSTHLPQSASLFGLGETTLPGGLKLPRGGKIITLWNADSIAISTNINLYGSHPFYMDVRDEGQAHGVFLLNSNGMDVTLGDNFLNYRIIGGVLDFYLLMGPGPEQVVQQYHDIIGRSAMPPRWALGFHQSKYGYSDLKALQHVVDSYRKADIPLEVIWSDIDYMKGGHIFTFDEARYPISKFQDFVDRLHAASQRWVPIVDCGVSADYDAYSDGLASDIFIQDRQGSPLLGQVWGGPSSWPDFLHPNTAGYWQMQLAKMRQKVPFDGIWLDMNEMSNFCPGDTCMLEPNPLVAWLRSMVLKCSIHCKGPRPWDTWANPPYAINNFGARAALGEKTVAPTASHARGVLHYNAHNLYSLTEARATYWALANITQQRPFILSRSSFPGLGKYAAHWTGDNAARFDNLKYSIAGVLNSNMWGISLAGADICGFIGESNEELCARWMSAGAFYPFTRNHGDNDARAQEAFRWPRAAAAARKALGLKYQLLPYLYSSFYLAHRQGGTVARPLFFQHPADAHSIEASSTQWLLGDSVLVAPVLQKGADSVEVYFPPGGWYSAWDHEFTGGARTVTVSAPVGEIPVYIRAGSIVPMQQPAMTTTQTAASPVTLLITLPVQPLAASIQLQSLLYMQQLRPDLYGDGSGDSGAVRYAGSSSSGNGSSAGVQWEPAAYGMLYADDGTTLDVGGDSSLEAWFTVMVPSGVDNTQASSRGSGRLWSRVQKAPAAAAVHPATALLVESVVILGVPPASSSGTPWQVVLDGIELAAAQVEVDESKRRLVISWKDASGSMPRLTQDIDLRWSLE